MFSTMFKDLLDFMSESPILTVVLGVIVVIIVLSLK